MKNSNSIISIIREIEELETDIEHGIRAWESGDDPYAMAACDPSDQFCQSEEIDRLIIRLKELVAEI